MLNNAVTLADLRLPPSNRLEKLSGDRSGQYSIRLNDQRRINEIVLGKRRTIADTLGDRLEIEVRPMEVSR
jgi:plasmid maintenance system killer protein